MKEVIPISNRKLDKNNRWRNKTVSFRMSPEENELLDSYVRMSGLEKQEYLIQRALEKSVVVKASPKVYFNLKSEIEEIINELKASEVPNSEVLSRIDFLGNIINNINNSKEILNNEYNNF